MGSRVTKTMVTEEVKNSVEQLIKNNKILMFSKAYCPYCVKAKSTLDKLKVKYEIIELNGHPNQEEVQDYLLELTGARTVPRVFINGSFIGGGDDTVRLYKSGELQKLVS